MKVALTLVALTISGAALAQTYGNQGYDQVPDGVSGPGITTNQTLQGTVIAVLDPIVRNVPTGQNCNTTSGVQNQSSFNAGTIIGGVAGGLAGSLVGRGDGRKVAIAVGAATGAVVGNDYYKNSNNQSPSQNCQQTFEQRIVGYQYVAQYQSIQVRGTSTREPRIGDAVKIQVRATFWAGGLIN